MNIPILYEDDFLLVIDKPPNIVVNKAESVKEETIQEWMEKKCKMQNAKCKINVLSDFYQRGGVVHRIDKETSGVLILAKTEEVFQALQKKFKERTITKAYTALVHGITPKEGDIRAPIARLPWSREKFGVVAGGREAVTAFKSLKYLKSLKRLKFSLVAVYPKTGRTHQIRVHFKYLGHPLVSDPFYGGRKMYKEDRTFCPRLFLHASNISFEHPVFKKTLSISSALLYDLANVLKKLEAV